jgi:uncharacterized protein (TIGR02453 family)
MQTHFTPETIKFLRGLKRHNDRDWFEARRDIYERALRQPMLALAEEISHAMESFAPDHVRPANKVVMRIYRDTRFSKNKLPYKTHLAAWWARRGMEKTSGGGFYLQVGIDGVLAASGCYMPQRDQLLAIRRWMSAHHSTYRAETARLMKSKLLAFTAIDASALTRMPKGFAADDPADELLRAKSWGVHAELPATLALDPRLAAEVVKRFKASAPLVAMLNEAIVGEQIDAAPKPRRPLF